MRAGFVAEEATADQRVLLVLHCHDEGFSGRGVFGSGVVCVSALSSFVVGFVWV